MSKFDNLTWEDIKKIVETADVMIDLDVMDKLPECCASEEGYYTEILNRLKEKPKSGCEQIREERQKQITRHGYTPEHDSGYKNKELLRAALTYLIGVINDDDTDAAAFCYWPFETKYYHNDGYAENLKKAGAFIAAELDRLNFEKDDN